MKFLINSLDCNDRTEFGFAVNLKMGVKSLAAFFMLSLLLLLTACSDQSTMNNPYPSHQKGKNIVYTLFTLRPNHLDPARSYSSNEYTYIGNIYEPPLQYHYLKRPYELMPLTTTKMPEIRYLDKNGKPLSAKANHSRRAFTVYRITIKKGIKYQPHPAFARDDKGKLIYHSLTAKDLLNRKQISDFKKMGTRELIASDYVYQIKRLAHPHLHSPIFSTMSKYIVGLGRLKTQLAAHFRRLEQRQKLLEEVRRRLGNVDKTARARKSLVERMLFDRQQRYQSLRHKLGSSIARQNTRTQRKNAQKLAAAGRAALLLTKLLPYITTGDNLDRVVDKFIINTKAAIRYSDLSGFKLLGVTVVDRYTYELKIKEQYPQIMYWLAMPFFSPVAPEVDRFYTQAGMKEKNISMDWYPVGTGAYMLTRNDPNSKMILERNPNFRGMRYPTEGTAEDKKNGLLKDAGKMMPFVDKVIFSLEKESLPIWSKFLQGYYDMAGIGSESFDQAVKISLDGDARLTKSMRDKNIKLITTIRMTTSYMGFNMLDPLVGGKSERARKLRQAISVAIDYDEYISIFLNGRGEEAQGPIPPGIVGYQKGKEGINSYSFVWSEGKRKRKSIVYAKQLLSEAGYPNGRDRKTGKPLIIYLEAAGTGSEEKAQRDWYRKQLAKIDIQLEVRETDYNRFQEKMSSGKSQLFQWGWNADYPDPENFLFLLYGPNGKVKFKGENAANYNNPEYNKLFRIMETMPNGSARSKVIKKMVALIRHDAPWIWGYHSKSFILYHDWYQNAKPHAMAHNTLMYKRLKPKRRVISRVSWNKPVFWPLWLIITILIFVVLPAFRVYRNKVHDVKHKHLNKDSIG